MQGWGGREGFKVFKVNHFDQIGDLHSIDDRFKTKTLRFFKKKERGVFVFKVNHFDQIGDLRSIDD